MPHPPPRLQDQIKLTVQLGGPLQQLQAAATRIAEVSRECGLEVDTGAFLVSVFSFRLIRSKLHCLGLPGQRRFGWLRRMRAGAGGGHPCELHVCLSSPPPRTRLPSAAARPLSPPPSALPCNASVHVPRAEEYVKSFRPFLMDVIYAWSKGATFGQVGMHPGLQRAARRAAGGQAGGRGRSCPERSVAGSAAACRCGARAWWQQLDGARPGAPAHQTCCTAVLAPLHGRSC